MKEDLNNPQKKFLPIIVLLTLIITSSLAFAAYYINYWPTDSYRPYVPTAAQLFQKHFLSQMHDIPVEGQLKLTMHGKETLILGIALMQKILKDPWSLYPNVLLLLIAVGVSAVLVYVIFRKIFNGPVGLLAYLLFAGCFWPYTYALQGAHQPLVLMNFLLSVFFLLYANKRTLFYALAGVFLGFMLFSSPTAVLYLPYFAVGRLVQTNSRSRINFKKGLLVLGGFLVIFFLFTLPDPAKSIKDFLRFLHSSQNANNFVLYREYLGQIFPLPARLRGAGAIWIFEYFFLIMPVLFAAYLAALAGISMSCLYKRTDEILKTLLLVLTSLSTPLLVELSGVAQFGRNYFSWLPGILLMVCYALYLLNERLSRDKHKIFRTAFFALAGAFLLAHTSFNVNVFFNDVFPSRMATTYIHGWLIKNRQAKVYVYSQHPRNLNFVQFLNNPKAKEQLALTPIENIRQAADGYILIPPLTGKCIYQECRLGDFYADPYLTELFYSKDFSQYAAASFETLASSKIWTQEEEICTYRDLILRDISREDRRKKGKAYLLDAAKLQEGWFSQFPKIMPVR